MITMTAYCNSPNPSLLRETDGLGKWSAGIGLLMKDLK